MDAPLYRDILAQNMLRHGQERMPQDWLFQQDNDPKHVSGLMMGTVRVRRLPGGRRLRIRTPGWFAQNNVRLLRTPSMSPDLNPIEHLWAMVKQKLRGRRLQNKDELWRAVQQAWDEIPLDKLISLVNSMPSRINAVIRSKGYHTKY